MKRGGQLDSLPILSKEPGTAGRHGQRDLPVEGRDHAILATG